MLSGHGFQFHDLIGKLLIYWISNFESYFESRIANEPVGLWLSSAFPEIYTNDIDRPSVWINEWILSSCPDISKG